MRLFGGGASLSRFTNHGLLVLSNPRRRNSSQATSGSKACKTQISAIFESLPLPGSSAEPPLLERTAFRTDGVLKRRLRSLDGS